MSNWIIIGSPLLIEAIRLNTQGLLELLLEDVRINKREPIFLCGVIIIPSFIMCVIVHYSIICACIQLFIEFDHCFSIFMSFSSTLRD